MNVRFLVNSVGATTNYNAGDVVNLSTDAANDLIAAHQAVAEGPSPSGAIYSLYSGAGYTPLTPVGSPAPSGYISPSGFIPDVASNQIGFYVETSGYVLHVVFPGRREVVFDILKMRSPAWR